MSTHLESGSTLFNTLANPLATQDISRAPGDTQGAADAKHLAALVTVYGALGLGGKMVFDKLTRPSQVDTAESDKRIRSALDARTPSMQESDPDRLAPVANVIDEATKRRKAIAEAAQAQPPPELEKAAADDGGSLGAFFTPALKIAGASAALYGGTQLADHLRGKSEKERLEEEIEAKKKRIDNSFLREYLLNRYPELEQSPDTVEALQGTSIEKAAAAQLALKDIPSNNAPGPNTDNISDTAKGVYALYALTTGALAHKASKDFSDNRDPERQKIKALRKVLEDRARVSSPAEMMAPPAEMQIAEELAKQKVKQLRQKPTSTEVAPSLLRKQLASAHIPGVTRSADIDPSDSNAALLSQPQA